MISNRHWATANGLQYTFLGLMSLGWWLCCGNFFFSIVVNSIPTLVPMMLNENGSSNKLIGFAVGHEDVLGGKAADQIDGLGGKDDLLLAGDTLDKGGKLVDGRGMEPQFRFVDDDGVRRIGLQQ